MLNMIGPHEFVFRMRQGPWDWTGFFNTRSMAWIYGKRRVDISCMGHMSIVIFILVMSQLALGGNLQFSQFFQKLAWKTGPTLVTEVVQGTTFGSRENTLGFDVDGYTGAIFLWVFMVGKNSVSFRDRRLVFHYCTSWYRNPAYKQRS